MQRIHYLFFSLSVGYIDDLGRFVTEIEPDPQRKYGMLLKDIFKVHELNINNCG